MSQLVKAKSLIKENKYCLEAWTTLIKDAKEVSIDESREFFESLVSQFPTCARFWKIYIEEELKTKNNEAVKRLFDRCLNRLLSVDLWKCFLTFVKETSVNMDNNREIVCNAYESALDKIGLDVMSYAIWTDYINFIKSLNTETVITDVELTEKIRSIYQRGIVNPMINVEQFWKEYCAFENQLDAESANITDDLTNNFNNTKKISREYENVTRPLERHIPATPPQATTDELRQMYAWKKYISWEKQNPLKITDRHGVIKRVMFAYEQSFLCLAYQPDIWYEAANYLHDQSKQFNLEDQPDDAIKYANQTAELYERALGNYMPNSLLLHLAYASFEEERSNFDKAKEIFDKCSHNSQVDTTLLFIQYMRFMYRTKGIKAAREVFKLGREDPRTTYQLYIAAADMEYLCTKDKTVAFKIFQLGAKKFPSSVEFMLAYIKYMANLNEDNNTRVLFERILTSNDLTKEESEEIWSEFLKFECYSGDLASILKVDKKRQKAIDTTKEDFEKSETALVIDRFKFLDLLPCTQTELKTLGYTDIKKTNLQSTSIVSSKVLNSNCLANSGNIIDIQFKNDSKMRLKYPQPDESQMLPFKPVRNALPGLHVVPGGIFPFPPMASELVKKLPPPQLFTGPFVMIDDLLQSFLDMELNEDFQPLYVTINGEPIKDISSLTSSQQSTGFSSKRAMQNQPDSDEEDTKKNKTDIYTQRLHKKFAKT